MFMFVRSNVYFCKIDKQHAMRLCLKTLLLQYFLLVIEANLSIKHDYTILYIF